MSHRTNRAKVSDASDVYTRVFEASPDYITISRLADGRYIDVNPGFQRFTGYKLEEVVGRTAFELGIWPDKGERDRFVAAVRSGSTQPFETELGVRTGERRSVEMAGSITEINSESVLVAVVRDVSERRRVELELAQYRQSLEHVVAERTDELRETNEQLHKAHRDLQIVHERVLSSEKEARFRSQHDRLTGLPNRGLLHDRLMQFAREAERKSSAFALLFIDLDSFKQINDTLGHQAGDDVLCAVSERLCATVRKSDTVARLGGDEFVVVLSNVGEGAVAAVAAQKILDKLKLPVRAAGQDCQVGCSIGISLYPRDGRTAEALLQTADSAMYDAKARGRGNYQFHSDELQVASQERRLFDHELRQALALSQFELHYQPVVDMQSGEVVAAEALLRWHHPKRGMLASLDFMALAEECPAMLPLGEWVVEEACRQLAAWQKAGHTGLRLMLNLSPLQLRRAGLVDSVAAALQHHGLAGERLCMEIPESVLDQPNPHVTQALEALAGLGIRLFIGDFGSGRASLRSLQAGFIAGLKIQPGHVQGMQDGQGGQAFIRAVVAVADPLCRQVIAAGVETAGQVALLKQAGCRHAQGLVYGEPVTASGLIRRLTSAPA